MVNLKEMKLVEMPARDRDPVVAMRDKIVDRLREQAQLLTNPDHVRVTRRWKGKEGDEYEQGEKVRGYGKTAASTRSRSTAAGLPSSSSRASRASPSSPATSSPTPSRRSSGWPATARPTN